MIWITAKNIKTVKKGDVIGLVGSTGRSTGNHLHFGIRKNGSYVDPLKWVAP
jgi:murein DD-endopeptidase MepM/ murein hydrolase activator NlpD